MKKEYEVPTAILYDLKVEEDFCTGIETGSTGKKTDE